LIIELETTTTRTAKNNLTIFLLAIITIFVHRKTTRSEPYTMKLEREMCCGAENLQKLNRQKSILPHQMIDEAEVETSFSVFFLQESRDFTSVRTFGCRLKVGKVTTSSSSSSSSAVASNGNLSCVLEISVIKMKIKRAGVC